MSPPRMSAPVSMTAATMPLTTRIGRACAAPVPAVSRSIAPAMTSPLEVSSQPLLTSAARSVAFG